jgi:hypothetical protein
LIRVKGKLWGATARGAGQNCLENAAILILGSSGEKRYEYTQKSNPVHIYPIPSPAAYAVTSAVTDFVRLLVVTGSPLVSDLRQA